ALARRPPSPALFPYTTLFRSGVVLVAVHLVDVWPDVSPATQWRGHIRLGLQGRGGGLLGGAAAALMTDAFGLAGTLVLLAAALLDRKSTRLNSSHVKISYAVF